MFIIKIPCAIRNNSLINLWYLKSFFFKINKQYFSLSPIHLEMRSDEEIEKNVVFDIPAVALAIFLFISY